MLKKLAIVALTAMTFATAGCTAEDRGTGYGALAGGALGAGTGALVSGNKGQGALIGGALGAGAGAIVGNVVGRSREREGYCRYSDGNVYRCPQGY